MSALNSPTLAFVVADNLRKSSSLRAMTASREALSLSRASRLLRRSFTAASISFIAVVLSVVSFRNLSSSSRRPFLFGPSPRPHRAEPCLSRQEYPAQWRRPVLPVGKAMSAGSVDGTRYLVVSSMTSPTWRKAYSAAAVASNAKPLIPKKASSRRPRMPKRSNIAATC